MIMFPIQHLHKHQQQQQQQQQYYYYGESNYYTGGSSFDLMRKVDGGYECYNNSEVCLESDLVLLVGGGERMAEDGSRTTSSVNEAAGSSSKDIVVQQEISNKEDEKWLQLGLGSTSSSATGSELMMSPAVMEPMARRGGLVELNLLPGRSSSSSGGIQQDMTKPLSSSSPYSFHMTEFRPPRPDINTHSSTNINNMSLLIHHHQQQQQQRATLNLSQHYHHQNPDHQIPWGLSSPYRPPNLWNPTVASSSSSVQPPGSYFSRTFQHSNIDIPGPSSDMSTMKVVDAPPRPHSGIWFVLQASQNQSKEPFLPQIPKSYLRIKDGRMTVRVLMKYLVNKLRLNSESEVEIRCREQELEPSLTLQHVRDNIWSPKEMVTLLPDSTTTTTTTTTTDHVMILHYGRISSSSSKITTTTTNSN